jgi:uncharacterized oxidoreductase
MKLSNRTVLITGGATGIGFSIAKILSGQNNNVIITGRKLDKLQEAKREVPALEFFQCDISNPDSIDSLFVQMAAKKIVLDMLFNNAGVIETWNILKKDLPSSEIFLKLNTNLAGQVAVTQRFIRQANKIHQNFIVNMSSDAAIMPIPILPLYSASKAGFNVFTLNLRAQLPDNQFRVIEIYPPATETRMTTSDMVNTGKLAKPDVFAKKLVDSIEAGKVQYTASPNARLLRFIRRIAPKAGLKLVDKASRKTIVY